MTNLGRTLTLARDEWVSLEKTEKEIAKWLPQAVEKMRALELTTSLDAPDESIDALIRLDRRIQLARKAAGGIDGQRSAVINRVVAALHALNPVVSKFSSERCARQFFLAGPTPIPVIADALACIENLLEK
jgi:hypothetical protein